MARLGSSPTRWGKRPSQHQRGLLLAPRASSMPFVVRFSPLFPRTALGREGPPSSTAAQKNGLPAPAGTNATGNVPVVEPAAPSIAAAGEGPAAAPAAADAEAPSEPPVGACVQLVGLKARAELNGQLADVIGPLKASGSQAGEHPSQ